MQMNLCQNKIIVRGSNAMVGMNDFIDAVNLLNRIAKMKFDIIRLDTNRPGPWTDLRQICRKNIRLNEHGHKPVLFLHQKQLFQIARRHFWPISFSQNL